jgi:catechol 2,3-dioxygenase
LTGFSQAKDITMQDEPVLDLAHLGHLELLTPKPDESLRFFVDVLGMTERPAGRLGLSARLG